MSRSARLQLIVLAVGVAVFGAAMAWLLTHRKVGPPPLPPGVLAPPKLSGLKAVEGPKHRLVSSGDTLTVRESIDFEIEVADLCFVYVVSAWNGATTVQWKPDTAEPWDKGAYAPNWSPENPAGLRFASAGDVDLFVLASPLPVQDIDTWSVQQLSAPAAKCKGCAVSAAKFKVVEGQAVASAGPDAGSGT